jgi:hypothetical protein
LLKQLASISIALIILIGCSHPPPASILREGDLLFQDLDCGALCEAIETVTEGVDGKDFSHCGMVVSIKDTLRVVEAIGEQVRITSVEAFFKRSGDSTHIRNISLGRVKSDFAPLIEKASSYARQQVGEPYDDVFLLDNGKWYCSELLYESFKAANEGQDFFELQPMTFKDPVQNQYFPAWVSYFKALDQEIPEGEPGLNPGSISRSNKIDIIPLHSIR